MRGLLNKKMINDFLYNLDFISHGFFSIYVIILTIALAYISFKYIDKKTYKLSNK